MTTPVVELIAEELEARLLLTTGVAEVVRPKVREAISPQDKQIVITQDDPEIDEELSQPGNPPATAWQQVFRIKCFVAPSETSSDAVDTRINQFTSDAVGAAGRSRDSSPWHTLGGYAINAQFGPREDIEETDLLGAMVPLTITYRTDETDLTVSRG